MVSAPLTSTQLASLLERAQGSTWGTAVRSGARVNCPPIANLTYLVGPSLIVGANRISIPRWRTSSRIRVNRKQDRQKRTEILPRSDRIVFPRRHLTLMPMHAKMNTRGFTIRKAIPSTCWWQMSSQLTYEGEEASDRYKCETFSITS